MIRIFFWFACALACGSARADPESGRFLLEQYSPRRLHAAEHPVGPQFFGAVQDAHGALMIANNYGLLEFDGARWRTWPNELASSVLSLARDPGGRILAGGSGTFGWYERAADGSLRYHSLVPELGDPAEASGDFWFTGACAEGAVYRSADMVVLLRPDGSLRRWREPGAFHLSAVVDGRFYVRHKAKGLMTLSNGALEPAPGGAALVERRIYAFLPYDRTRLLFVTREGVRLLYDRESGALEESPPPPASADWWRRGEIYSALALGDGRHAIGTVTRGLALADRDGNVLATLDRARGLRDDLVFALHQEPSGDLWALLNDGASRILLRAELSHFGTAQGLDGFVEAVTRFRGELYAAASQGVYRLRPGDGHGREAGFERVPGSTAQPWKFLADGDELFVGGNAGIYRLGAEGFAPVLAGVDGNHFVADPARPRTWYASTSRGLQRVERGANGWSAAPVAGVPEYSPGAAFVGRDELWLGSEQQRAIRVRLDPGRTGASEVTRFGAEAGVPSGASAVFALERGWVLGTSRGLLEFDAARSRFVSSPPFRAALADTRGAILRVWRGDEGDLHVAADDRLATLRRGADGGYARARDVLELLPRGGRVLDLLRDEDGRTWWIGSDDGLFRWRRDGRAPLLAAAPVRLSEVVRVRGPARERLAFAQDGDGARLVDELPSDVAGLVLAYAVADFGEPGRNLYRTRVDGLEPDFGPWMPAAERELSGLRHGQYRLLIEARNVFGSEARPLAVSFGVRAPWYLSPLALAGEALLALALAAGFVRWRHAALAAHNVALERLVAEKTRALTVASLTDPLTGLHNRRYFDERVRPALARGSCALTLIDLDRFKHINDHHGHGVGDLVLVEVARRLRAVSREGDHVLRWGGEEFLVALPGLGVPEAAAHVARLLGAVSGASVAAGAGDELSLTCSIGWTVSPFGPEDAAVGLDDLLVLADKALYLAKRRGRSRACGVVPGPAASRLAGSSSWKRMELEDLPADVVSLIATVDEPPPPVRNP